MDKRSVLQAILPNDDFVKKILNRIPKELLIKKVIKYGNTNLVYSLIKNYTTDEELDIAHTKANPCLEDIKYGDMDPLTSEYYADIPKTDIISIKFPNNKQNFCYDIVGLLQLLQAQANDYSFSIIDEDLEVDIYPLRDPMTRIPYTWEQINNIIERAYESDRGILYDIPQIFFVWRNRYKGKRIDFFKNNNENNAPEGNDENFFPRNDIMNRQENKARGEGIITPSDEGRSIEEKEFESKEREQKEEKVEDRYWVQIRDTVIKKNPVPISNKDFSEYYVAAGLLHDNAIKVLKLIADKFLYKYNYKLLEDPPTLELLTNTQSEIAFEVKDNSIWIIITRNNNTTYMKIKGGDLHWPVNIYLQVQHMFPVPESDSNILKAVSYHYKYIKRPLKYLIDDEIKRLEENDEADYEEITYKFLQNFPYPVDYGAGIILLHSEAVGTVNDEMINLISEIEGGNLRWDLVYKGTDLKLENAITKFGHLTQNNCEEFIKLLKKFRPRRDSRKEQ